MCGINGFIDTNNSDAKSLASEIKAMNRLIFHRGPDDDGFFTELNNGFGLAMGMQRLSIIDLHSGKQPIFSDDKELIISLMGKSTTIEN